MMNITSLLGRAALSLAFLCAATSARAGAVDSLVSISPDPADTLVSKTFNAEFTFSGDVTYDSVYVKSGSVENKFAVSASASTTATVPVLESYWSDDVTAGLNMISVSLIGVKDSQGNYINYSSGKDGVVSTSFRILATSTAIAEYVGCDQDPYWMLAQDLVDFPITFSFTDSITIANPNSVATVTYYDEEDFAIEAREIVEDSVILGWIPRTSYYGIGLYIPVPNKTWDDVKYVTIGLNSIKSNGANVTLPSPLVTFYTSFEEELSTEAYAQSKKIEGIQTIQGVKLSNKVGAKAANALKSGLYIINGKKVFVK